MFPAGDHSPQRHTAGWPIRAERAFLFNMTLNPTPETRRPRPLDLGAVRPILWLVAAVLTATLLTAGALVASIP